jgi:hypothetical protein
MRDELDTVGFVRWPTPFATREEAWKAARATVENVRVEFPLTVIGDFVIPPIDAPSSRDFQTLHFDFGLPLVPVLPADVARFTALYIGTHARPSDALTRLVPIRPLVARQLWPDRRELVRRCASYGHSHGAWDDAAGYVEGSLARIIEAALGGHPVLPSVKTDPQFLCGTEFASLAAEAEFFAHRSLNLHEVEIEVGLGPGELLVFDNLAVAHGRRGTRRPGELNQRVFGHSAVAVEGQLRLRNRVLDAFAPGSVPSTTGVGEPRGVGGPGVDRGPRRPGKVRSMPEDYFGERVARRYDEAVAEMFDVSQVEPAVEFLADMAGSGRVLELGIGTGRIALPLAERGVRVHGVDLSPAMVDRLRAKPGGSEIPVTIGDFATAAVPGSSRLPISSSTRS